MRDLVVPIVRQCSSVRAACADSLSHISLNVDHVQLCNLHTHTSSTSSSRMSRCVHNTGLISVNCADPPRVHGARLRRCDVLFWLWSVARKKTYNVEPGTRRAGLLVHDAHGHTDDIVTSRARAPKKCSAMCKNSAALVDVRQTTRTRPNGLINFAIAICPG